MHSGDPVTRKGRGAGFNPPNRFESTTEIELEQVEDDEDYLAGLRRPETEFLPDRSRTIIARTTAPTSASRPASTRIADVNTAAFTAMRGRRMSISGCRRGWISRPRSW